MASRRDKDAMIQRYYRQIARQQTRSEREDIKQRRARRATDDEHTARRDEPDVGEDWGDEDIEVRFRRAGRREKRRDEDLFAATVAGIQRTHVEALDETGDVHRALLVPERLPHPPTIGDRIRCERRGDVATVREIEPRETTLSRPDPGNKNRERVLAANVDVAVIVLAAKNPEFKPSLIDRFLIALVAGGVRPLVCVNKVDLCSEAERASIEQQLAPLRELGVDIAIASALAGDGLDDLRSHIAGKTVVFTGHSGVGKSALLNALDPGRARDTGTGREFDGKGRHTTTSSELRELWDGTRLIDTPGIREFGLWQIDAAFLRSRFPCFAELAKACRFADCAHVEEPDCAVRGAVAAARYEAYRKLLDEVEG